MNSQNKTGRSSVGLILLANHFLCENYANVCQQIDIK